MNTVLIRDRFEQHNRDTRQRESKPGVITGIVLGRDATELEPDRFKEYVALLLKGDAYSISAAATICGNAVRDADAIDRCREDLSRLSEAENQSTKAAKRHNDLQQKLGDVEANIARLESTRDELFDAIRESDADLPDSNSIRRRLGMTVQNPVVRSGLADELQRTGV